MPGPDYPWALYIPGANWTRRGRSHEIRAVILHARSLQNPADLDHLRRSTGDAFHYVVTAPGAVIQMVPEGGYCHHTDPVTNPKLRDYWTLAIAVDGDPRQLDWPIDQVIAVAHILTITFSVRGVVPVRDAASIAKPKGRILPITAWPWLLMQRNILRVHEPIGDLFDRAAAGIPPPPPLPGSLSLVDIDLPPSDR
jgi:hypothetical protein